MSANTKVPVYVEVWAHYNAEYRTRIERLHENYPKMFVTEHSRSNGHVSQTAYSKHTTRYEFIRCNID